MGSCSASGPSRARHKACHGPAMARLPRDRSGVQSAPGTMRGPLCCCKFTLYRQCSAHMCGSGTHGGLPRRAQPSSTACRCAGPAQRPSQAATLGASCKQVTFVLEVGHTRVKQLPVSLAICHAVWQSGMPSVWQHCAASPCQHLVAVIQEQELSRIWPEASESHANRCHNAAKGVEYVFAQQFLNL